MENVNFEQTMQKLVKELEESYKNSDVPDTSNKGTKVGESGTEKLDEEKPKNEQRTQGIGNTQITVKNNKDERIKQENSNSRRSTRSTTTNSQLNDKVRVVQCRSCVGFCMRFIYQR